MTFPPIDTSLLGIREQLRRLDETASRIAGTAPGVDLAEDLVDLKLVRYGVQANVAIVRTADEMAGALLDIFA